MFLRLRDDERELRALSPLLVIAAEAETAQYGGKACTNTHMAQHKYDVQETCVSLSQRKMNLEKMSRMDVTLNL